MGPFLSLFNRMDDTLLSEFIAALLESRQEDFDNIRAANDSYGAILGYIQGLNRDVKAFDRVFKKNNGFFTGFALGARIRRQEHLRLTVSFMDRTLFGVKGKVNAQASRVRVRPDSPTAAAIKGFLINIYFDAPDSIKSSPRTYNVWLAANLETILDDPAMRSSYVHEFTHVMDFRRMDPRYLLQRGQKKQQERERRQQSGEKTRNFGSYVNDPLELNAYFSQAMSDVQNQLNRAGTPEERAAIIGNTPQEFVDKFMGTHLKKQVRKNIDPENWKRLAKRASTSWELLQEVTYPAGFDLQAFKGLKNIKDRLAYAKARLPVLGKGSSRIVFEVDPNTALKIAMNRKGLAQNKTEIDSEHFMTANIYAHGDAGGWLEMEKAAPVTEQEFEALSGGISIGELERFVTYNMEGGFKPLGYDDAEEDSEFFRDVIDLVGSGNLAPGDVGRLSSWGKVNRNGTETLTMVDFGLDISTAAKFY